MVYVTYNYNISLSSENYYCRLKVTSTYTERYLLGYCVPVTCSTSALPVEIVAHFMLPALFNAMQKQ